jgi:hypothetical protein
LQVLQAAIQAALTEADVPVASKVKPRIAESEIEPEASRTQVDGEEPSPIRTLAAKYETAQIKVYLGRSELHSVGSSQLSTWLAQVVEIEGPIHWMEAARRVATAAGVQKVGSRIQEAFKQACRSGSRQKLFIQRSEFLFKTNSPITSVRDRSDLPPQSRKLEYVAPEEIGTAIELVVNESFGLNADDVATATCRLLGFARVSEDMRTVVEKQRDHLVKAGRLIKRGEVLVCSEPSRQVQEVAVS